MHQHEWCGIFRTVDAKVAILDTVDSCNEKPVKWSGAGSSKSSGEESRVSILVPVGSERQNRSKNSQEASLKNFSYFGNTSEIMKREEVVATCHNKG